MSDQGYATGTSNPHLTEAQQADLNVRLYNRMITMPDVKLVAFHTLRNGPTPDQKNNPSLPAYHFGFLREDWSTKPVFCAFIEKAGRTYDGC
jgi:hypothetical protein